MSTMEDLLENQQQIIEAIEKIATNFGKDSSDRKTADYIRKRVETLDKYWAEFQQNHNKLCSISQKTSDYFTNNAYENTNRKYLRVREQLIGFEQVGQRPTTPVIKPATLIPSSSSSGYNQPQQQQQQKSQGINSKTDDLLRKQASNFRAFQRTVSGINLESVKDKWEFEDLLKTVQARWTVIDTLHWEIDSELEGTNQDYERSFADHENTYNVIKKAINSKMWSVVHREKSTPKMDIPLFYGTYQQWSSFKDLFLETIHNNPALSNAQKMQFLKSKVKGEAERLIQHLQISSDNYNTCWDILNNRYNNKKMIFTSHINMIMNIPAMPHVSIKNIKKLHDLAMESLNAIKNLGVDISTWDPLLVHILAQKLDSETHNDYVESLKQPRELPSVKEFLEIDRNFD